MEKILRFQCMTCKRTYRLKQETASAELLCFHCGSVLKPLQGEERNRHTDSDIPLNREGFYTLLREFSNKRNLPREELELIEEMRAEGVVDTAWLRRNYQAGPGGETQELEIEPVEDFKPLVFGAYQALYAVGQGSTGVVYKGWKIGEDQIVAIKRLKPRKMEDPHARERFFRELQCLKNLSHPNILPLLDSGEKDDEYFLVMPFIEGGSLKEAMQETPSAQSMSDLSRFCAIVIQIGNALHHAHERGLVHRDVKPANILLAEDHPYLVDFGLARQIDVEASLPHLTRGAVGTPCYMAPELWERKVSPQADIYALAAILYEAIRGSHPFTGASPEQILAQQLEREPAPPIPESSRLPKAINGLLLRALSRDPDRRHRTAKEFTRELGRILV